MIRKVWSIAVTEFINTLTAKGFLLAVALTPLFIGGSVLVQNFLKERIDVGDRRFGVLDRTGRLFDALAARASERDDTEIHDTRGGARRQTLPRFVPIRAEIPAGEDEEAALSDQVRSGRLFAFVVIEADALSEETEAGIAYHTQTPTYVDLPQWIHLTLNQEIRKLRMEREKIDVPLIRRLLKAVPMRQLRLVTLGADGKPVGAESIHLGATFGVPAGAMFLLFLIVFMSAPMLLHSVLEEKQQRIWEVLISSVSPFQLLLGKLLGAVLVSVLLSMFYLAGAAGLARTLGVAHLIPPSLYLWFIFFELLGLLIYGSMFSAIGAACSELRDAQSLMMPAMLLIVIPMFGWVAILRAPASLFARGLSLFPPATPMLMLLRIALPPGPAPWEILLSIVLTTAFTLACVWAAGKIFRLGILAQGQTPTFGRLLSWILAK